MQLTPKLGAMQPPKLPEIRVPIILIRYLRNEETETETRNATRNLEFALELSNYTNKLIYHNYKPDSNRLYE